MLPELIIQPSSICRGPLTEWPRVERGYSARCAHAPQPVAQTSPGCPLAGASSLRPLLLWRGWRIGCGGHRICWLGFLFGLVTLRFCLFLWSGRFSGRSLITLRASVGHRQHAYWHSYRCNHSRKPKQPSARNELRWPWFAHGNPLTLYATNNGEGYGR
jgi:hypothetical protein